MRKVVWAKKKMGILDLTGYEENSSIPAGAVKAEDAPAFLQALRDHGLPVKASAEIKEETIDGKTVTIIDEGRVKYYLTPKGEKEDVFDVIRRRQKKTPVDTILVGMSKAEREAVKEFEASIAVLDLPEQVLRQKKEEFLLTWKKDRDASIDRKIQEATKLILKRKFSCYRPRRKRSKKSKPAPKAK